MSARNWAAIAFRQPVTLAPSEAAAMLDALRCAIVECSMPVDAAAELARRVLAATPGGVTLFSVSP